MLYNCKRIVFFIDFNCVLKYDEYYENTTIIRETL